MNAGEVIRLPGWRWCASDPAGQPVWISYQETDGLWQVTVDDDLEEHLDRDLRSALADITDTDVDDPWIVVLADEVEGDLAESEGGRNGYRQA